MSKDNRIYAYFYLQGERELTDALTNKLYEEGFDDALVSSKAGLVFLTFSKEIPFPFVDHYDYKAHEKFRKDWDDYHKKCSDFRDDCFKRLLNAGYTPKYTGDPNNPTREEKADPHWEFRKTENTTLEKLTVQNKIKGFYLLTRAYIGDVGHSDCGVTDEYMLTMGLNDGTQLYFCVGYDTFEVYDHEAEARFNYPQLFPTP